MAELEWPEDLGHGTFTGRFGWMDADGVDEGTEPDITAASGGTVEITPAVTTVRYTGASGPLSLVARRAVGIIDYEGYLCTKNADGTAGPRGMSFPATDNDALSPSGWTYRVAVKLPGGITLPTFSTTLATGAVVDLATAIPVDASPGVVKVVDETIAVRAEAAATRAEAAADGIGDAIAEAVAEGDYTGPQGERGPEGPQGPPGPQGPKGDPGDGGGGAGGINEVEGVVQIPEDGPRIREFYSVGEGVTMGGEFFPPDTAFVVRRRADGGSDVAVVGEGGSWRAFGLPPEEGDDVTPPTAGTLTVSTLPDSATLTVSGAMDDVSLHADGPYRFSKDAGASWTGWTTEARHTYSQLTPDTEYTFQHEVRDQAGNTKLGSPVTTSTPPAPAWSEVFTEDFNKPDGSALGGSVTTTGGITWSGTSGAIQGGRLTTIAPTGGSDAAFGYTAMGRVRVHFDYDIAGTTGTDAIMIGIMLGALGRFYRITRAAVTGASQPLAGSGMIEWDPSAMTLTTHLNGAQVSQAEHPSTQFIYATGVQVQTSNYGSITVAVDNLRAEVNTA